MVVRRVFWPSCVASALIVLGGLALPGARRRLRRRRRRRLTRSSRARPTTPTARWCSRRRTARLPGSTSARPTSAAARPTSPSPTRAARAASTPPTPRAACGRPTTTARPGRRCSRTSRRRASATSRSRRRTPTSSGSAPARRTCFARRCRASASSSRPTAAGRSQHSGLTDTQTIARILVHPTNPDIVYVAAVGPRVDRQRDARRVQDHRRRPHLDEGALPQPADRRDRSGDGSVGSEHALRRDVAARPPQVERSAGRARLQRERHLEDDRRRADLDRREPGPAGARSSAAASASTCRASNPNVLYAFVDNYEEGRPPREGERDAYARPILESRIKAAEIYRTDDKGATLAQGQREQRFHDASTRAPTAGCSGRSASIRPTRTRSTRSGLGLNVSRDAGKTFTALRGMHGDHHGLWIDPKNPSVLYNANDGGVLQVRRRGQDLDVRRRRPAASQFYNVALDTSTPAWAYGSIQDIGSRRGQVDLSQGPRPDSRGRVVERARRRRIAPRHRSAATRTSSIRTGSTATSRARIVAAEPRARRRPGRPGGPRPRRASRRHADPAAAGRRRSGAARAVDGADHRVAARSRDDLRRLSSSCSARPTAATAGSRSARI